MTEQEREHLRGSLDKAFNIYQATLAMVAIFDGFVFAALLQLLTSSELMNGGRLVSVYILTGAMLCLTTAAFCFHASAHRVIRYWKIFYPLSTFNMIGGPLFLLGVSAMLAAISALLFSRNVPPAAVIVALWALGLFCFGWKIPRMHDRSAFYMVRVDSLEEIEREAQVTQHEVPRATDEAKTI